MPVAVVTDSTAGLGRKRLRRLGVAVVPLHVVLGGHARPEPEVTPSELAAALRRWVPVTTSRPSPQVLLEAYETAVDAGADGVVSVHLSGRASGTVEAAELAAKDLRRSRGVAVEVVDTRWLAAGVGFAAEAAAVAARSAEATVASVAAAARERAAATVGWFCVDTLEHLRRGGRIGTAQALLGSALSVKPLLHVVDGTVEPLERVRTSSRALARMQELALAAAGDGPVELAVQHLAASERAEVLAGRLAATLAGLQRVRVSEVGAVVGAHVGPGMVAALLAPALPELPEVPELPGS